MLTSWVTEILKQSTDTESAIKVAQALARAAFALSERLKQVIDYQFGGPSFRIDVLDRLLRKERELDALRQRTQAGGAHRCGDPTNLNALLDQRFREYTELAQITTTYNVTKEQRQELEAYLDARRREIYLGDADRVRRAISTYHVNQITDKACQIVS